MKTLIIINGVTGALGGACLARFSRANDATIIGLSRQAPAADMFCVDGYLPDRTLVCAIGDISSQEDCMSFARKLRVSNYEKIIYVHAVGVYPFEVGKDGALEISHDQDGDGVDDRVVNLSYKAFLGMAEALQSTGLPIKALIFGGLGDKSKPMVHTSWWKVMDKIKARMFEIVHISPATSFFLLNISSVICPHELITRPYVFQRTNASPEYWLMPSEVADRVFQLTYNHMSGFIIDEIFHRSNYYESDYFADTKFTKRKMAELGL